MAYFLRLPLIFHYNFTFLPSAEPLHDQAHPPNLLPPILNSSSFITDISNGSTGHLLQATATDDIAVVLYYAPWCVHSRSTAKKLEAVAQQHNDEASGWTLL